MSEFTLTTSLGFITITFITLWFFSKAINNIKIMYWIIGWLMLVGGLGINGFYTNTEAFPPRLFFLLVPSLLFLVYLFLNKKTKLFIDSIDLKWLTLLHVIRIPVEIVLLKVFLDGFIPKAMTFEGLNFDIVSGITAPIIYYLAFVKKQIGTKTLLLWNIVCLVLLINIVTIAILSAPSPFQQMAFDQPNIGVVRFPLVWLPSVVVPIVLFSHLVSIKQLVNFKKEPNSFNNG